MEPKIIDVVCDEDADEDVVCDEDADDDVVCDEDADGADPKDNEDTTDDDFNGIYL